MKIAKIVVICGPSGAGKSTVMNELLKKHPRWGVVNSYTTRQPRVTEGSVKKYTFVTPDEFMRLFKEGEIIEYERVAGNMYGTSASSLEEAMKTHPVILFDLRYEGVRAMQARYPQAIDIYLRISLREARNRMKADARRVNTPRRQQLARLAEIVSLNHKARRFSHVIDSIPGDIPATVAAVEQVIKDA